MHIEKEYIDPATRRFVPVITDFSRTSQPIIRYRLNDILTEAAAPCACGSLFTAIERIEGRCDDTLYFSHTYESTAVSVFRILSVVRSLRLHRPLSIIAWCSVAVEHWRYRCRSTRRAMRCRCKPLFCKSWGNWQNDCNVCCLRFDLCRIRLKQG